MKHVVKRIMVRIHFEFLKIIFDPMYDKEI